jgi:hypothetical protein
VLVEVNGLSDDGSCLVGRNAEGEVAGVEGGADDFHGAKLLLLMDYKTAFAFKSNRVFTYRD